MTWLTGRKMPRIPGYDFAGTLLDPVPATNEHGALAVGDPVYGMVQHHSGGACAEVVAVPADQLAPIPHGPDGPLSFSDAASLPLAGLTALQALRDELGARPGETVLLNGASGGVGTLAVQIAKALGLPVVAVCSAKNHERVRALGADRLIDYTTADPSDERGLDHVFDIYGTLPWNKAKRMLKPGGAFCTTIPRAGAVVRGALHRIGLHRAGLVVVQSNRADLEQLAGFVREGAVQPVVDRVLPLEDSAEAHAYLETRRAKGKVVLRVRPTG
jgi:NADPH:quinone reductase-like Zn-dependent oxidoreductase